MILKRGFKYNFMEEILQGESAGRHPCPNSLAAESQKETECNTKKCTTACLEFAEKIALVFTLGQTA